MQIKHVFFDLDHTLWDFETNSDKAYLSCFENHRITVDFNRFMLKYKPINEAYWKRYRENQVSKDDLKYGRLKDAFNALNYAISDDLIFKIAEEYLELLPQYNHLFDGTIEILEYLKPKYQLHIITNGFSEIQNHKLFNSGLHHYFDKIITSENAGVKKPNPLIFEYALQITQAKATESMMIGDNLEADVNGALQVGFSALHFVPEQDKLQKNQINQLRQIVNYL